MSGFHESGICLVSWRGATSTVSLCDRCRAVYTPGRFCEGCLHQADANLGEKRGILFPMAYDPSDSLSSLA